jgi:lysophospholipase L1-like esterase
MRHRFVLLALVLSLPPLTAANAAPPQHWVGTWATAIVPEPNKGGLFVHETTLSQVVHVSMAGSNVRVVLTNEFGTTPLLISGAEIATTGTNAAEAHLTFAGQTSVTIPAGAVMLSDAVPFKLAALSDLTIKLLLPAQDVATLSEHSGARATNYMADGDQLAAASLTAPQPFTQWLFLKSVDVQAAEGAAAIVTFGDSITDGARSTNDANARWPDGLARRLQAGKSTADLGVLNLGIGGNRILHGGPGGGPSALSRFDRDVISQTGVRYVILLEGINDIGHMHTDPGPEDVTAPQIIAGMEQLILRAHSHGIKIIGATLTPDENAHYGRVADREAMREALNDFIRNSGKFDGVIDFEKATRDPEHPTFFLPAYDSGDHLHPGDAGYKAMADSINLALFSR